MRKLDRLVWADGIAFESYGLKIGVRADDRSVLHALADRFPPGWRESKRAVVDRLYSVVAAPKRRVKLLYVDFDQEGRAKSLDELADAFAADLHAHVAANARRRVFLHAGSVAWQGSGIVLPGRTFTGKTTATAAFVKAGARYLSDEFAVLDGRGRLHPFARPLGMRQPDGTGIQRNVPIERLGGIAARGSVPVRAVLFARFREGARWRPRTLTPGEGALRLMQHTMGLRERPEESLAALEAALSGAAVFEGIRGDAAQLIDFVRDLTEPQAGRPALSATQTRGAR